MCRFLDMLERYFEQPEAVISSDVRKDLYYQVGTTPAHVELPRDHAERSEVTRAEFNLSIF